MKKAYMIPLAMHESIAEYTKFVKALINKGLVRRGIVESGIDIYEVYCVTHISKYIASSEEQLDMYYDLIYVYDYEDVIENYREV